jgi:hypothetical protein
MPIPEKLTMLASSTTHPGRRLWRAERRRSRVGDNDDDPTTQSTNSTSTTTSSTTATINHSDVDNRLTSHRYRSIDRVPLTNHDVSALQLTLQRAELRHALPFIGEPAASIMAAFENDADLLYVVDIIIGCRLFIFGLYCSGDEPANNDHRLFDNLAVDAPRSSRPGRRVRFADELVDNNNDDELESLMPSPDTTIKSDPFDDNLLDVDVDIKPDPFDDDDDNDDIDDSFLHRDKRPKIKEETTYVRHSLEPIPEL